MLTVVLQRTIEIFSNGVHTDQLAIIAGYHGQGDQRADDGLAGALGLRLPPFLKGGIGLFLILLRAADLLFAHSCFILSFYIEYILAYYSIYRNEIQSLICGPRFS